MRRNFLVLGVVALAAVLAGCSSAPAPLTAKNVRSSIEVVAPADTLIGDAVAITAKATIAGKRRDKVEFAVERSTDGTTWTTLAHEKAKGPKLTLTAKDTAAAAGDVQYRSVVRTVAKAKTLATSDSSKVSTADIKKLVRKFYYDRTQAYKSSSRSGTHWDISHDSSIYNRSAKSWKTGAAGYIKDREVETSVPDLDTIELDTDWLLKKSSCNPAMKTQPEGRTFVVTVELGGSSNGYPFTPSKADVHVTYADGKLVDYIQLCVK